MPAPASVTIHLVRHGQSTWNVEGRLQGQTSHPPLTDLGREQAREAGEALAAKLEGVVAGAGVAVVAGAGAGAGPGSGDAVALWSSDLVRAAQTAQLIGDRLGLEVHLDDALREQGLGSLQGRLTGELEEQPTPNGCHISEIRWGGGESLEDVHRRVGSFFTRVLAACPPQLIVVTHGDALRVARAFLEGRDHRSVTWDVVPNGSVTSLVADPGVGPWPRDGRNGQR